MNEFLLFALAGFFGALIRHFRLNFFISSRFDHRFSIGAFAVALILLILTICIKFSIFSTKYAVEIIIFFGWLLPVLAGAILGYLLHFWIASSSLSYQHLLILTVLSLIGIGPDYFSRWVAELGIREIGNVKFESTINKAENTPLLKFQSNNLSSVKPYGLITGLLPRIGYDRERIQLFCDPESSCEEIIKDLNKLENLFHYSLAIVGKSAEYTQMHHQFMTK